MIYKKNYSHNQMLMRKNVLLEKYKKVIVKLNLKLITLQPPIVVNKLPIVNTPNLIVWKKLHNVFLTFIIFSNASIVQ